MGQRKVAYTLGHVVRGLSSLFVVREGKNEFLYGNQLHGWAGPAPGD